MFIRYKTTILNTDHLSYIDVNGDTIWANMKDGSTVALDKFDDEDEMMRVILDIKNALRQC